MKAILSKNMMRIYYRKIRGKPYRTLSLADALTQVEAYFPGSVDFRAASSNIEMLVEYRDNAIHFYNRPGFASLIYALAQTSIVNFRDVVQSVFGRDLARELTLSLLPLTVAPPIDPVEFLRARAAGKGVSKQVSAFTARLRDLIAQLETEGRDTGRLLTSFTVHLVSTKKIAAADVVVGVQAEAAAADPPMLVERRSDPNRTHPYREVDIIGRKRAPTKPGMGLRIGSRPIGSNRACR